MCSGLTSASFPECTYVDKSAFTYCVSLSNISFPKCSYIDSYAFSQCTNLSSFLNLPLCEFIGSFAFQYCSSITEVSIPECLRVEGSAFYGCWSLSSVYMPKVTYIDTYAFYNTKISELVLSNCGTVNWSAFQNCSQISHVSISGCFHIGSSAFAGCSNMTELYLSAPSPSTIRIRSGAFSACTQLNTVILHGCSSMERSAFYRTSVKSLYLYGSQMVGLASRVSFIFYPLPVSVFVPESLYGSYTANMNWSNISSRFVSMV